MTHLFNAYIKKKKKCNSKQDTGVDIRPDDVAGHIKVEFDELSLRAERKTAALTLHHR